MRNPRTRKAGDNTRGLTVGIISTMLGLAGGACLAVACTHQAQAPQPLLATSELSSSSLHQAAGAARDRQPAPTARPPGSLPASLPLTLSIPAIGVQSPLIELGQRPDGSLAVPAPGPHYNQPGWYRYSPPPGSIGPAVIAGHVDSAHDGPSVFFRLGALRPHDTVFIGRADKTIAAFSVDTVRRYHKTNFPTQLVYGNTTYAALRLITCGGSFDRDTGHYLDNIVVTASLIHSPVRATPGPPASSR